MYVIKNLINIFKSRKNIPPEAIQAYLNRLPDSIQVAWFRDGEYIIGNVEADKYKFVTQGKDADDFIKTVNDSILVLNNIPADCIDTIKEFKPPYMPPLKELHDLSNLSIKKSNLLLNKTKQVFEVA